MQHATVGYVSLYILANRSLPLNEALCARKVVKSMKFQSNIELLDAIEALQMSLVSSNNEQANAILVKGMSSLNGLTDGWAQLLESADLVYKQFNTELTQVQLCELKRIQSTVSIILHST